MNKKLLIIAAKRSLPGNYFWVIIQYVFKVPWNKVYCDCVVVILIQIKIFSKRYLSTYSMQGCNNSNCQPLCRCVWSSIGKEMCCVCGWREYADEGDLRCPAPYRATTAVARPSNLVWSQGGRSHEAHRHSGRHIFGLGISTLVWTIEERCLFLCFQSFYHFQFENFGIKERYNS